MASDVAAVKAEQAVIGIGINELKQENVNRIKDEVEDLKKKNRALEWRERRRSRGR